MKIRLVRCSSPLNSSYLCFMTRMNRLLNSTSIVRIRSLLFPIWKGKVNYTTNLYHLMNAKKMNGLGNNKVAKHTG